MSNRSEPTEPPVEPVNVERVGDLSRLPVAFALLIGAGLVIAIAQPWQSAKPLAHDVAQPPASAAAPPPTTAATPTTAPTIDPLIDAASGRMLCNAPHVWRLVTMETTVLGDSRTMYGTEPSSASGPNDPSIPTAQLHASVMYGIGVCRPNPDGLRLADLPFPNVTVWSESGRSAPRAVPDPYVIDDALFRLGEVYLGPPRMETSSLSSGRVTPSWQPGRYVLEIADAAPHDQSLWLALDFSEARGTTGLVSAPTDGAAAGSGDR